MRHKYLLRHPVSFGVIASFATPDLLKQRAHERAEQERKASQATVYVVRDGRGRAVASH